MGFWAGKFLKNKNIKVCSRRTYPVILSGTLIIEVNYLIVPTTGRARHEMRGKDENDEICKLCLQLID